MQTAPGALGRNTFFAASWWNLDLSVFKNTTLPKETTLQLRAEFFNLFGNGHRLH